MAIKTVDKTKVINGWNSRIFFPKDQYILRCVAEKIGPNSNKNPMVTNSWEIVNQAPKQVGDVLVEFDGVKFDTYHVLRVKDESLSEAERKEKSDKCFLQYQERFLEKCGIDCSEGWDDENPPSLKGKVVYASVYGQERPSYKSPTPEEQAKGQKVGEIMKDPITGKEVITYNPQIEIIFGLYDGEVARPF